MKHLFTVALVLFSALALKAQNMDGKKDATTMSTSRRKNCVMMKDGKMMVIRSGKIMMMNLNTKLSNGTMVMNDGTVKMQNGKQMMMKDGDTIMINGKMKHMAMKPRMYSKI